MTKLNNDINDFEISDGKNHVLYFTDDKLKLRTIDIDVQPIIDAIETTIYNMLDAKQLKYNGLKKKNMCKKTFYFPVFNHRAIVSAILSWYFSSSACKSHK